MIDRTNDPNLGGANEPDPERDPDLDLILDYLTDELGADQMAAVLERLAADDAFYGKMQPMLLAMSLADEVVSEAADPELARRLAGVPHRVPSFSADTAEEDAHARAVVAAVRQRSGRTRTPTTTPPVTTIATPLAGRARWSKTTERTETGTGWRLPPWVNPSRSTLPLLAQVAAGVMLAAAGMTGVRYAVQHMDQIDEAKNEWLREYLGVTNHTRYPSAESLPGGSQVRLAAGSRMQPVKVPGSTGLAVRLDGDATVEVTDAEGALWVVTAAGEAFLTPGRYKIAAEDSSAMQVSVERGMALVRGRGGRGGAGQGVSWVTVGAGQHVRVPR